MKRIIVQFFIILLLSVSLAACKDKPGSTTNEVHADKEPPEYALERQRIIAESSYDKVSPYSDGMAIVERGDSMGAIDANGKEVVALMNARIQDYYEGLAHVESLDREHQIMYMDKAGKKAIDLAGYTNAFGFSNGYAVVADKTENFGLMDKTGKLVLPCIYDEGPDAWSNGMITVHKGPNYFIMDGSGKQVSAQPSTNGFVYDEEEKLFITAKGNGYVYVDNTGKEVKPYPLHDVRPAHNGLTAMPIDTDTAGTLYGYVRKTGEVIVPYGKYYTTEDFAEGLGRVGKKIGETKASEFVTHINEAYGFVDTTGKEVVPCKYDRAGKFSCGRAMVAMGDKYGYIDKTGKEIIALGFAEAGDFQNGYAKVRTTQDGLDLYIDVNGKVFDQYAVTK